MALDQPIHVETVFVIRVRGRDVKSYTLEQVLPIMAEAMVAAHGDPEAAKQAVRDAFLSAMGAL